MKKTVIFAVVALLVAMGIANAQEPLKPMSKPLKASPKPPMEKPQNPNKTDKSDDIVSQVRLLKPGETINFVGMIVYDIVGGNKETFLPSVERNPGLKVAEEPVKKGPEIKKNNGLGPKGSIVVQKKEERKAYASYTKEGAFLFVKPLGIKTMRDRFPMICCQTAEEQFFCSEIEGVEWPLVEKDGKLYERMGKKKIISGIEATLYRCHLKGFEGELWVAEQLVVTSNTPFYGLKHPVLEFDLNVTIEDKVVSKCHLEAKRFVTEIRDKEKDLIKSMIFSEMVPQNEVIDMLLNGK